MSFHYLASYERIYTITVTNNIDFILHSLSETFPGQTFYRSGSMFRGNPPYGQLLPIRNPYIDSSVEDPRASTCFDQISLLEGPVFSLSLNNFIWKILSPNSSTTTSKDIKKFQKMMGRFFDQYENALVFQI